MPDQPDEPLGDVFTPDRAEPDDARDLRDASAEVQAETETAGEAMIRDSDETDDLHRDPSRLAEGG